jgi:hypothetical protein
VPDPARSSVPNWIIVVGRVNGGTNPDPVGLAQVVVRDFANSPIAGATVTIDFSGCCDINLCSGQAGHDCVARTVTGLTNGSGVFAFTVMGAAKDPGTRVPPASYGGCALNSVQVRANAGTGDVILGNSTPVTLDLNGAAGQSNGTTGADISNEINFFGAVALGAPYRGRADMNCSGSVTGADIASMIFHVGRLALSSGVGCVGGVFCAKPACP